MKIGTVAYIPPRGVLHSEAFMANIQKNPAKHPLFLMSDSAEWNPSKLIKSPELIGKRPAWAVNNAIFLQGLELAREVGLDFFLYLESDSRAGCKDFDAVIFDEFFGRYSAGVSCAGSPVVWDLNSGGREFALRVVEMAWKYQQAGDLPMSFQELHPGVAANLARTAGAIPRYRLPNPCPRPPAGATIAFRRQREGGQG